MSELDQLVGVLTRIAEAFEEQNRMNAAFREEDKVVVDMRYQTSLKREQMWHDEAAARYREQVEREQALHQAYMARLNPQEKTE